MSVIFYLFLTDFRYLLSTSNEEYIMEAANLRLEESPEVAQMNLYTVRYYLLSTSHQEYIMVEAKLWLKESPKWPE